MGGYSSKHRATISLELASSQKTPKQASAHFEKADIINYQLDGF
jgi:hypothetical protein